MNKEGFAKFLEEPSREKLRDLLKNQTGEYNELDFKAEWPVAPKLARHVLAIANYGGGCIIAGVEENEEGLNSKGLSEVTDKAKILKGIEKFLSKVLFNTLEILDFNYKEAEYNQIQGKKFQVLIIGNFPKYVPFMSEVDSDGLHRNRIYTRRNTESIEASFEEVQKIINRRIDTGYSSTDEMELTTHLAQLKTLYEHIDKYKIIYENSPVFNVVGNISNSVSAILGESKRVDNPNYPKETYEEFISKIIEKKKSRIELELDIKNLVEP